jgi:hypothetical protein
MAHRIKKIVLHVPKDPKLLASLGELAIRHEHLNYVLRLTLKSLTKYSLEECMKKTKRQGSEQLIKGIRKAAIKLPCNAEINALLQLLPACKDAAKQRNALIHGLMTKNIAGEAQVRDSIGGAHSVPSPVKVKMLSNEIKKMTGEINSIRTKFST